MYLELYVIRCVDRDNKVVSFCINRRDKVAAEREYKKKKNLKKKQRLKELEEQRESEKNKWQNFNSKVKTIDLSPRLYHVHIQMLLGNINISIPAYYYLLFLDIMHT